MEVIILLLVLAIGLSLLDAASLGWGVDSRPTIADDHQR
jgi:hypothetical protein